MTELGIDPISPESQVRALPLDPTTSLKWASVIHFKLAPVPFVFLHTHHPSCICTTPKCTGIGIAVRDS